MTLLQMPKTTRPMQSQSVSRKRGSTILLVLAMLSILLLLAIAFSYGTRLETQASYNYAQLSQARMAATTGLPMAASLLRDAASGVTNPLQPWNTLPPALNSIAKNDGRSAQLPSSQLAAMKQAGLNIRRDKAGNFESGPPALVEITDLSGQVNINAVSDAEAMGRLVSAVVPGGNTVRKAQALMELRSLMPTQNGSHAQAGARAALPADSSQQKHVRRSLDPRDPDAQLIESLQQLSVKVGGQPLFSDQEIEKIDNLVTAFSQAPEIYNTPDGRHIPRLSLAEPIDAELVYARLKEAFPKKDQALLRQFAANLADYSDTDDTPTILDMEGRVVDPAQAFAVSGASSGLTFGVEMTPVITEVYPDSATGVEFGDDGQFVEIANPWSQPVSLAGWTLHTAAGASFDLGVTLPPGGILLVTDNMDHPLPNTPAGQGSVTSIFGQTADGSSHQVVVVPNFDLQDRNSHVSLYNNEGHLVDVFAYGAGNPVDSKMSFQRPDPIVRGSKLADATPFAIPPGMSADGGRTSWADGNTTITRISTLFTLSSGYVEKGEAGQVIHPSQMPALSIPTDLAADEDPFPTNLDLRLVDIFTVSPLDKPVLTAEEKEKQELEAQRKENRRDGRYALQEFRDKLQRVRNGETPDAGGDQQTTSVLAHSYGKLNVNTCSKYALLGLDLGDLTSGGNLGGLIEKFDGYRLSRMQKGLPPFLNVSDFIAQFQPDLSRSNLAQIDQLTDQISVGSSAFKVVAHNRLAPQEQKTLDSGKSTDGPRPATATAEWVVSMDHEPYSIISFTLTP